MEETLKHADIIPVLYKCLLIFGIAGLIVPLFNRMHVSPVIGFLVSGILISPNLLTAFDIAPLIDLDSVNLMGELGILALLFMIGLELSFEKLKELKKYIFGLGSAQVLVTGSIIACIALFFGNALQTSIIIGFGFSLSSTAIVMQLLKEYKLDRKANGRISFSILLMQDMAVVPILVMIGAFAASASEQSSTPLIVILSLVFASIAVGLIYFIGKKILQPVLHKIVGTNKNEWLVTFVLFIVCLISIITQKIGLSAGLGAFLAGLMIAETEFCEKIEKILYPLKSLLLGVFFVSIGMKVDVAEILSNPILLAMSVVGIFFVKGLTLYPLCRSFGMKRKHASEIAMTLCQPGEFTLMVISVSMAMNLLPVESAQFFLLVTVLGMLVTPFVFKMLPSVRKAK